MRGTSRLWHAATADSVFPSTFLRPIETKRTALHDGSAETNAN